MIEQSLSEARTNMQTQQAEQDNFSVFVTHQSKPGISPKTGQQIRNPKQHSNQGRQDMGEQGNHKELQGTRREIFIR